MLIEMKSCFNPRLHSFEKNPGKQPDVKKAISKTPCPISYNARQVSAECSASLTIHSDFAPVSSLVQGS